MVRMSDGLLASLAGSLSGIRVADDERPAEASSEPSPRPTRPQVGQAALDVADQILGQPRDGLPVLQREGRSYPVGPAGVVIGRRPDASGIEILDARVSRRHARVTAAGASLHVVDLGSSNGTYVDRGAQRLTVTEQPVDLIVGDRIVTINDVVLAVVEASVGP